jgi:transcriptional regulator with XRE-family HTH domain
MGITPIVFLNYRVSESSDLLTDQLWYLLMDSFHRSEAREAERLKARYARTYGPVFSELYDELWDYLCVGAEDARSPRFSRTISELAREQVQIRQARTGRTRPFLHVLSALGDLLASTRVMGRNIVQESLLDRWGPWSVSWADVDFRGSYDSWDRPCSRSWVGPLGFGQQDRPGIELIDYPGIGSSWIDHGRDDWFYQVSPNPHDQMFLLTDETLGYGRPLSTIFEFPSSVSVVGFASYNRSAAATDLFALGMQLHELAVGTVYPIVGRGQLMDVVRPSWGYGREGVIMANAQQRFAAELRHELRRTRMQRGMLQREVAAALDWSLSKLIRIETGVVGITVTDLRALLAHYGVTDPAYVEKLCAAARDSRRSAWWDRYQEVLTPQYQTFLAYEGTASTIREYSWPLIPGLLQTAEYARALISYRGVDDRLIYARRERSVLFGRQTRPGMCFILDEAGLHRWTGAALAGTSTTLSLGRQDLVLRRLRGEGWRELIRDVSCVVLTSPLASRRQYRGDLSEGTGTLLARGRLGAGLGTLAGWDGWPVHDSPRMFIERSCQWIRLRVLVHFGTLPLTFSASTGVLAGWERAPVVSTGLWTGRPTVATARCLVVMSDTRRRWFDAACDVATQFGWPTGKVSTPGWHRASLAETPEARTMSHALQRAVQPQPTRPQLRMPDTIRVSVFGPTSAGKTAFLARTVLARTVAEFGMLPGSPEGQLVDDGGTTQTPFGRDRYSDVARAESGKAARGGWTEPISSSHRATHLVARQAAGSVTALSLVLAADVLPESNGCVAARTAPVARRRREQSLQRPTHRPARRHGSPTSATSVLVNPPRTRINDCDALRGSRPSSTRRLIHALHLDHDAASLGDPFMPLSSENRAAGNVRRGYTETCAGRQACERQPMPA